MKSVRKIIFWVHLSCGVTAGVVIFMMSVTGALLAFEKNIVALVESDARTVAVPANGEKRSIGELLAAVAGAKPGAKPSGVLVQNDPAAAVAVSLGRDGLIFVDPYTAEIKGEGATGVRAFFRTVTDLHRYIAMSGDGRPVGKALTGIGNLILLFLAISGIYIWMPRRLSWKRIKPVFWFRRGLRGKARNFNWHNVIGFWSSLVLIVLTLTATVMSYQWASNLLYTLSGNEVPQQTASNAPSAEESNTMPENLDAIWAKVESPTLTWKSISLRLPVTNNSAVFTIDEGIYWNIFGRSTLTVDVANATVTKWEPYGGQNSARQLRSWFRFTHTGESGGILGQFIGFLACIGGSFLVWTGFSLAFRRCRNWLRRRSGDESALTPAEADAQP